jgi:hypothetical protein
MTNNSNDLARPHLNRHTAEYFLAAVTGYDVVYA